MPAPERPRRDASSARPGVCHPSRTARYSASEAPILILDEATAQVDPASESEIHRALTALSAGRTVVVIAHRLATIASADRILVIDSGRIAEQGTHDDLLAANGQYAALWARQETGAG